MAGSRIAPGNQIGSYILQRLIGQGGVGLVYEALHPQTKRRAAVKILSETASHEPEIIERFKIEAKVLERLNHVNIVKMLEFGNDQGYYYMALEHVDGFPLDDYLRRRRKLHLSITPLNQLRRAMPRLRGILMPLFRIE
jgi:serine/threonine-protein kinase